jgi:hypothetical protein
MGLDLKRIRHLESRFVVSLGGVSFAAGEGRGASGPAQLRKTLEGLRAGPLPRGVVERIEGVWEAVKDEAILDNYNGANF